MLSPEYPRPQQQRERQHHFRDNILQHAGIVVRQLLWLQRTHGSLAPSTAAQVRSARLRAVWEPAQAHAAQPGTTGSLAAALAPCIQVLHGLLPPCAQAMVQLPRLLDPLLAGQGKEQLPSHYALRAVQGMYRETLHRALPYLQPHELVQVSALEVNDW